MPPVPRPPGDTNRRKRLLLIALVVALVVTAVLIAGSIILGGSESDNAATGTTTVGGTPAALALIKGIPQQGSILGRPTAPTRMLQYEDLQCPICKEYTDAAFPTVIDEYVRTGRLKLDFRGLAFLGDDSQKALRIALAAGKQNKLWDVAGLFYANQGVENSGWVTDELVDEILAEVPGLDAAKVKADAKSEEITKELATIQAEASANGVQGTPAFFIATGVNQPRQIQVALTPESFRSVLNQALQG